MDVCNNCLEGGATCIAENCLDGKCQLCTNHFEGVDVRCYAGDGCILPGPDAPQCSMAKCPCSQYQAYMFPYPINVSDRNGFDFDDAFPKRGDGCICGEGSTRTLHLNPPP